MPSSRLRLTVLVLAAATGIAGGATIAAVSPARDHPHSFQSPTRNIGCYITSDRARCDIRNKNWSARRPRGCRLDFGHGLFVTKRGRRGKVLCAGDTVLGSGRVLRYGRRTSAGSITCLSRRSGITCVNFLGHGFFISRQRYRLF